MAANYPLDNQAQKYADETAEAQRLTAEQVKREEAAKAAELVKRSPRPKPSA